MRRAMKSWLGVAAMPLLLGGFAQAQDRSPPPAGRAQPGPPGPMSPASKDPASAPAGTYRVDLEHASAVARVLHRGISYSVLRFGVREGTLLWNPAKPSAITLAVTVDAKPFYAPIVYRILPEGPQSLDVAKYPDAKFVSTAVRVKAGNRATIDGRLTLMGVTRPVVINAEFVGAGRSMEGASTIGFTGTMLVDTSQFTQGQMARMVGTVTVVLDAEFLKQ